MPHASLRAGSDDARKEFNGLPTGRTKRVPAGKPSLFLIQRAAARARKLSLALTAFTVRGADAATMGSLIARSRCGMRSLSLIKQTPLM
jgi:hypothetical protein